LVFNDLVFFVFIEDDEEEDEEEEEYEEVGDNFKIKFCFSDKPEEF
jgi:hypothetical protein